MQRISPSVDTCRSAVEAFEAHVKKFLAARLKHHQQLTQYQVKIKAPFTTLLAEDQSASAGLKELSPLVEVERRRFRDAIKSKNKRSARAYSIPANTRLTIGVPPTGLTIGVPPYDVSWLSSPIAGKVDQSVGTFEASALDTMGFEASALGIFLSSATPANVRFSADVSFHVVWFDWPIEAGAVASSEGGVGVLVYAGSSVVSDERQELWSNMQSDPGQYAKDEEWIFLTQTNAGQTYFSVEPNITYLIWVWCWTVTGLVGSALSSGHIDAEMPFVVVERL